MAKNSHWGAFIFGAIMGAMAGAGAALLFTPRSGEEIRGELLGQTQGVQGRFQTIGSQVQSRAQGIGSQVQTRVQTVGSQVQTRSQGLIDQGMQVVQRGGTPVEKLDKHDAADADFAGAPPESRSPIVENAAATNPEDAGSAATADDSTVETRPLSPEAVAPTEADRNAAQEKAEGVKPKEAPDYAPIQPESEVQARSGETTDADVSRTKPRNSDRPS